MGWKKHERLWRMRGETPLPFDEWQRCRARLGNAGPAAADGSGGGELDLPGRGLWCTTNMEDAFDSMASADEKPPDEELPSLGVPDMLSAMTSAPGAEVVDAKAWAQDALRKELIHACATDRTESLFIGVAAKDVRLDAIAMEVNVGDGNAAVLAQRDEGSFMCAYRFKVEV